MSHVDATSSPGRGPEPGDIDERDALFVAYLEGDLSDERQQELERELERDDELRRQFDKYSHVVGAMQELPMEFAPPDFVDGVQRRIRARSQGRFFAENFLYNSRMPYEAIAVVMIVVMAAAWLMMSAPKDNQMQDVHVQIAPQLQTETQD